MKYTMEELFAFMDLGRSVVVTDTSGQTHTGRCWAYGPVENEEEYGVFEPSVEIGPGVTLYASEIEKIEVLDP